MKKSLLVGFLVFLAVFLLWPTKQSYGTCNDTVIIQTENVVFDCALPEKFDMFGGGIRFIFSVIAKGGELGPENSIHYYFVGDNSRFHTIQAFLGGSIAGFAAFSGFILLSKTKNQKMVRKK